MAFLETFLDKLLQLLDLRKGDFDGEQRLPTSRLFSRRWTGFDLRTQKSRIPASPRLTLSPSGYYRVPEKAKSAFLSDSDLSY